MMSIDAWHPEAETFIRIKEDLNKINKANLSVEVDDYFMNYVTNPGIIAMCSEVTTSSGIGRQRFLHANKIFNTICESAWKSAEPGILFVDRLRNYNMMEFVDDYQIEATNPCGRSFPSCKTSTKIGED